MTIARRLVGCAAIVALVGTACSSNEPTGPEERSAATYERAACPNPMYPAPDLGPDVECGYLTVPQNRAEPDGKKIRLPVAVHKSKSPDPKPDPVVYLAGGPGGTPMIHQDTWQLDRDLILFGQRGTFKGDPFLGCSEYDRFLAEAVGIATQDPAYASKSAAAIRECRDRFAADGIDLAAYNSSESSADVADLRTAMGIDQWNIYALSYGTDLALQVLRNHPDGIRSVVLDSVDPPPYNLVTSGWQSAASGFNAIFDGCAAQPACAAAFPGVRGEFIRMVNELSANPIRVTVDFEGRTTEVLLDGYKLASGVVVAAAQIPGQLARIPSMIHKLANGDPADVARAAAALTPPDIVSYGLQLGVLCSEDVARTTPEEMLAVGRQVLPGFPDAVVIQPAQVPTLFSDCEQWDVPAALDSVAQRVASDLPILMVSGPFDSATPPHLAFEAALTLPNSRRLTFPGTGHEVALNTPDAANCFIEIMRGFYDDPADYNTDCVAALKIPPFVTS